jgi:alginate O-acetyltransferase complex protein AlgI
VFLTFHFVCFAWVFFRAPTFGHAALTLQQLARGAWSLEHIAGKAVFTIAVAAALHLAPPVLERRFREGFVRTPAIAQGLLLAAAAMGLHMAAGTAAEPFVYGQF